MNPALDKLPQHEKPKKRSKTASPTARTLQWCKKAGIVAGVVERYNQYTRQKNDLFGFIDLVACVPGNDDAPDDDGRKLGWDGTHILGIQATSGDNVAARVKKIIAEPRARNWLEAGGRIVVHGWSKMGKAGKRKTWQLRVVPVTLADLDKPEWCPI